MKMTCPSQNRLREFLEGAVGDADADQISDHVEECASCDHVLSSLESEQGDVLQELRNGMRTESLLEEPEFERLRNSVRFNQADTTPDADAQDQNESGTWLRDYRLVKKIGEGGMGTVYQAFHVHLAKHVAIKILPADKLQSGQAVKRFRQEMRAVGKVNHPNVIGASDAGTIDGQHFLVMDLVQGADVARIMHDRGPLSVADACEVVRQAAIGLQHAHDNGLVHRDVKPSNIMLALDGSVKLLDLGLAGLNNSELGESANVVVTERLTSVGQVMGTLDYMAPEQITASPMVDGRADIYALGATLFQLLTGRTPCGDRSEGTPQRIEAVLHQPPMDITTLRSDVPEELRTLLTKMLAKQPEDRPSSARDVAGELVRFASDADLVKLAEACRTSLDMPSVDVDVTDDVSFIVSRAQPESKVPPQRPWTAIALLLVFVGSLAAVVFYIKTNVGTVRVRVMDDSLEVRINGEIISMNDSGKEFTFRAGEEQLVVTQPGSPFELVTDKFEIHRDEEIVFDVELLGGEVVVKKDGVTMNAKPVPERINVQQILDRVVDAYADCDTYHDSGVVATTFVREGSLRRTTKRPFRTAFVRPDQFRYEFTDDEYRYIIAAQGKDVQTWWDVQPGIERPKSLEMAVGAATGVSGGSSARIPSMLMPERLGFGGLHISDAKQIGDGSVQDSACFRVQGEYGGNPITLWIDKESFLILRIDESMKLDDFRTETTTTYTPVINGTVSDEMLKFDPPESDEPDGDNNRAL